MLNAVTRENAPLRLTGAQLGAHPEFRGLRDAPGHPPLPDYLAAPLIGRDGTNLGIVQLSHRTDDQPFTAEDEAVLVQLAQMASSTIERLEAYAGERAAREQAERAAGTLQVLSQASAMFAERFDPLGIAQALVDLVVPRLADFAVVHLVDEEGDVRLGAVQTSGDVDRGEVEAFFGRFRVDLSPDSAQGRALLTGRAQVLPGLSSEALGAAVHDATELQLLRSVCARAACACR